MNLTDSDWEILRTIKEHQPIGITQIKEFLPNIEAMNLRLSNLAERKTHKINGISAPIKDTSYLTINRRSKDDPLYEYDQHEVSLTELGNKALQDHLITQKKARRELWLKNAWIPILVSFVTTIITTSLWPTMQRWLLSLLQRII